MSYAIETKKRKFERILESLTDSASSSSRTTLSAVNNVSETSIAQANSLDSSKRRRVTPVSKSLHGTPSTTSLTTHYLPSSRAAFLSRLETYRDVTKWHIPSTSAINAAEWAKHGWICDDTDVVICPACKEGVAIDLELKDTAVSKQDNAEPVTDQDEEGDALDMANAVYEALVKRYSEMTVTAHKSGCAWRRRGCDASIQRIEGLLNTAHALTGLKSRYDGIAEEDGQIPQVSNLPSSEAHTIDARILSRTPIQVGELRFTDENVLKLATCGWLRKDADIVECRHCFRSLGLWLYRGSDPTIEQLDPIDSHLEYCPWRSATAQDTEIGSQADQTKKERVPGWLLIYLALAKGSSGSKGHVSHNATSRPNTADSTTSAHHQLTPDQRDTKMKDLRQRIRDLKKPFNIKSLLKRKDKTYA